MQSSICNVRQLQNDYWTGEGARTGELVGCNHLVVRVMKNRSVWLMWAWLCSLLHAAPSSPLLHRFLPSHYVLAAALHAVLDVSDSSASSAKKFLFWQLREKKTCESIAGDALSLSHDASWSHLLQTEGVRPVNWPHWLTFLGLFFLQREGLGLTSPICPWFTLEFLINAVHTRRESPNYCHSCDIVGGCRPQLSSPACQ